MRGLFAALEKVSGVKAPTPKIPVLVLYLLAAVQESWARLTKEPVLLSWATVRLLTRETGRTEFNHEKSQRELGLVFRSVEETLRDEIAWYRANGWLPEPAVGHRGNGAPEAIPVRRRPKVCDCSR
jgi:hypothetical protein